MRSRTRATITSTWALALLALPLSGATPGLGPPQWTLETGG